jgi:hypothetical protein
MQYRQIVLLLTTLAIAVAIFQALYRSGGKADAIIFVSEVQRGGELGARLDAVRRRFDAKHAVAAEVLAGKMTVREAAEEFRRMDEADADVHPSLLTPDEHERDLWESVVSGVWVHFVREHHYAAAARWFATAFKAEPHLIAGPPRTARYLAACAAARAGSGQGRDAEEVGEEGRVGFRRQALGWLRDELEARRSLEGQPDKAAWLANDLGLWLWDSHFDDVRGPESLARLPEPGRQAWQKLWADVADTVARTVEMIRRLNEGRQQDIGP